ncbi:MAG: hypothetical protein AAB803_02870 [Patescibacteria group bacterium]
MRSLQSGFVFSELVIAIGVIAILAGFATVNLLGTQHKSELSGVVDTLLADVRQQQTQAMAGAAAGSGGATSYGIYFEPSRYTLFSGPSFDPGNPENQVINLPATAQFTNVTVPNGSVAFAEGSGAFTNFATGQDSLTVREENSGQQKTLRFNALGVVISIE